VSKKPMSPERQFILDKTKGKCLYCGLDLTGIKWQADHFHPIIRHPEKGTCVYPKLDTIDNLFPSCAPCNNFKSSNSIEGFRRGIQEQQRIILKSSTGMRQLSRLGLVEFKDTSNFKFWFEHNNITVPTRQELLGIDVDKLRQVKWNYDEVDLCHCTSLPHSNLTLRLLKDGYYMVINTGIDWEQKRMSFPAEDITQLKIKTLTWAIEQGIVVFEE